MIRHEYGIFVLAPQPSFVRIMLMLASRNVACFPRPRLQNSPYFCVFKYARTVKQKVWSWEVTLKIRSGDVWGALEALTLLLRHTKSILRRKKIIIIIKRMFSVCLRPGTWGQSRAVSSNCCPWVSENKVCSWSNLRTLCLSYNNSLCIYSSSKNFFWLETRWLETNTLDPKIRENES